MIVWQRLQSDNCQTVCDTKWDNHRSNQKLQTSANWGSNDQWNAYLISVQGNSGINNDFLYYFSDAIKDAMKQKFANDIKARVNAHVFEVSDEMAKINNNNLLTQKL